MKLFILFSVLFCGTLSYTQTNCNDLKKEILSVREELVTSKNENSSLKAQKVALEKECDYLKKVLEVNKPIKEVEVDGVNIKITNVDGILKENTIYVTFLLEAKISDRTFYVTDADIVDLEGNTIKSDYDKLYDIQKELTLDVPTKMKMAFTYKSGFENGAPSSIKLVRIRADNSDKSYSLEGQFRSKIDFRDLDVNWR
jgi:transposase